MDNNQYRNMLETIIAETEKVIIGKHKVIEHLLICLLAEGHVLIEDVPGVGKTTLAAAIAKATGLDMKRAQFTPDVMSSDITGFSVYNKQSNTFEYRNGLAMCNILLADEINRTSPKTQSALLEAMEEGRVSVDGVTHRLPEPFFVIATQNEVGFVGTYPLPEAQLDRFLMKISMGYPTVQEEVNIIAGRRNLNPIETINPICTVNDILACIEAVKNVNIDEAVLRYIAEIVGVTRRNSNIALGASPRASLALMRTSQGLAFLRGRDYVIPEDVIRMIPSVIPHRITLTQEAKLHRTDELAILKNIVKSTTAPVLRAEK